MHSSSLSSAAFLAILGFALCLPAHRAEALTYSGCVLEGDLDEELESGIPPDVERLWETRCRGYSRRLFDAQKAATETLKEIRRDLARLQKIEQPSDADKREMTALVNKHYYVKTDFYEEKLIDLQSLMNGFSQYETYRKNISRHITETNEKIDEVEFKRLANLKQNDRDGIILLSDDDYL